MLRSFKAMLGTYKAKDIIRAYNVGCGLCALLVAGVTTYDIHRSIKANDTPPSREQLEELVAAILALRQATNIIIHAGDVGDERYKRRLTAEQLIAKLAEGTGKKIVPVAGNVDQGCIQLPTRQTLNIFGKKIVVIHICGFPSENTAEAEEFKKSEAPDIVVFGHSHVPGVHKHDHIVFINPGSAGPRRFKLPRCIVLYSVHKSGNVSVEFMSVGNLPQDVWALPIMYRDPVFSFQVHDSKYLCSGRLSWT